MSPSRPCIDRRLRLCCFTNHYWLLGIVNLWLLIGYAANLALILASILIARGAVPALDKDAAFAVSQGLLILLLPAGIIMLRGAVRSQGKLRRLLGYSVFGLDLLLSLSGIIMISLVLFSGARVIA